MTAFRCTRQLLRRTLRAGTLLAFILPPLTAGCSAVNGLMGGQPAMSAEAIRPTASDAWGGGEAHPAKRPDAAKAPSPPAEEKLLPKPPSKEPGERSVSRPAQQSPPQSRTRTQLPGRSAQEALVLTPADFVYRDAMLAEDTTWRGEVHVEGALTVAPQATLTVEPGTVVRFRRGGEAPGAGGVLLVQGRLVVKGSDEKPVRFTSQFQEPLAGDWQGVVLLASEKKNLIEQCRVEGAEIGVDASFSTVTLKNVESVKCGTGIRLQDCVAAISGGGARECDLGVEVMQSEADIREASFRGNRQGMAALKSSLYAEGVVFAANSNLGLAANDSRVVLVGGIFEQNGNGLALAGCEGSVSGGKISGNREIGISLAASRVKVSGNEIARNGGVGLRVEDGRGLAWGNSFVANGRYDVYNAGVEDFRAIANWWGEVDLAAVEKRIYRAEQDAGRGRVLVAPVLRVKPRSLGN